jgi:uncharacterized phage protein gp47/JayE
VTFVLDDTEPIVPDEETVSVVQAYIDGLRPVTADVYVFACQAVAVNFSISLNPLTAAVKSAVESELRDLLRREASPAMLLLISHIREAISLATGEVDHVLNSPSGNVQFAEGEFPVMGAISWE